ncbi:MAG: DUF4129 domain-containing protein [Thermoplasmata archaeon]|nr:MAG: DUF4129 domain-containing protein [Thermoplasmata archaeon]
MKGRRFVLLALLVAALLLIPYSGLSSHRDSGHRPYDELQDRIPSGFFDSDGDLLKDSEEPIYGTDPADVDTDDDLMPDGVEVIFWLEEAQDAPEWGAADRMPLGDADRDGTPNILDPDSDNDGLLDGWEAENGLDPAFSHTFPELLPDRFQYYPFYSGDMRDLDDDGIPDDWEAGNNVDNPWGDADHDGVNNVGEYLNGTDPRGPDELYGGDMTKEDDDGDGVADELERVLGLDPDDHDTDGDGIPDGDEMYLYRTSPFDVDTDRDSLVDGDEIRIGSSPIMRDTDGDGLYDADEVTTDPTIPDTDKDLIPDKGEVGAVRDSDNDGLPDAVERESVYMDGSTDPFNPDTDGDGLTDGQEDANRNGRRDGNDPTDRNSDWRRGGETDPTRWDTDGGGASDRAERWMGRDPLDPGDDQIDTNPPDPPNVDPNIPDPVNPPRINFAGLGRVMLVALIIMFALVLLMMLYNTATQKEDFLEEVLEALEEGERVLYDITLTDDIREAIFRAYRRFLAVMDAYGYSKGEPSTAREFATQVRKAIAVESGTLNEFTTIFEEARYSDHEMSLGYRDRALAAFTSLKESVARELGSPDRPIVDEDGVETSPGLLGRLFKGRGKT